MLIAFRDGDPNGNGEADEVPFAFVTNDGFAQHLRSMYGIWGMPTKNGIAIRDGQAYFAPITQGYRDMITYMADLYSEGLIDPESFTMNSNDFNAKVDDPSGNIYGFVVARRGFTPVNDATANRGEFESIPPLRAPGYEPEMWVHPGRLAIKNVWFMTDVNPYPEHTMAFVDRFYTLENSVPGAVRVRARGHRAGERRVGAAADRSRAACADRHRRHLPEHLSRGGLRSQSRHGHDHPVPV